MRGGIESKDVCSAFTNRVLGEAVALKVFEMVPDVPAGLLMAPGTSPVRTENSGTCGFS